MPFIEQPPITKNNKYIKVRIINDKLLRCCKYCGNWENKFYCYFNNSRKKMIYTNVCEICHKERQSISDIKYYDANKKKCIEKALKWNKKNNDRRNLLRRKIYKKKNSDFFKYRKQKSFEDEAFVEWHKTSDSKGFSKMTYTESYTK